MEQTKKNPNVYAKIATILFAVCIILNMVSDIMYKVEYPDAPFSISEVEGYLVLILLTISALKNLKSLTALSILLLAISYVHILFLYEPQEISIDFLDSFKFILLPLVLFLAFLINIILTSIKSSSVIVKLQSYLCVIFGIVNVSLFTYEFIDFLANNGTLYGTSIERHIIDSVYSIVNYFGLTFLAISYCKKIEIKLKPKFHTISKEQQTISSYEAVEKLKGFHHLLDKGIITQEEYEEKKKNLL